MIYDNGMVLDRDQTKPASKIGRKRTRTIPETIYTFKHTSVDLLGRDQMKLKRTYKYRIYPNL
jgi:hypothetical protein